MNQEFELYNKLQISIAGFCINTPEDLEELLALLKARDIELRRLAKLFDLEHLIKEDRSNKIKN